MSRFFQLHFSRGRYDARNGVPLSELPALAKLESLVRSVARDLFFDGNDDRQRVSPGFDEAFQPAITSMEGGGSADCDVDWAPANDDLTQYYVAAQGEIVDILASTAANRPDFPPWFSQESARHLADWLEVLKDDEQIQVTAERLEPVTVGVPHREIVRAEANRARPEVEEAYQVVGRVRALTSDPEAVRLSVREGARMMTVPVGPALAEDCVAAWRRKESTLVRLTGSAWRPAGGRRRFGPADVLQVIEGPPLGPRLAELAEIGDGWLSEEGGASRGISRTFARSVESALWGLLERVGVARPRLFLTPEGAVEAMWQAKGLWRASLHFTVEGTVWGFRADLRTGAGSQLPPHRVGDVVDRWLAEHARDLE